MFGGYFLSIKIKLGERSTLQMVTFKGEKNGQISGNDWGQLLVCCLIVQLLSYKMAKIGLEVIAASLITIFCLHNGGELLAIYSIV
jgi:hypothetical protein